MQKVGGAMGGHTNGSMPGVPSITAKASADGSANHPVAGPEPVSARQSIISFDGGTRRMSFGHFVRISGCVEAVSPLNSCLTDA